MYYLLHGHFRYENPAEEAVSSAAAVAEEGMPQASTSSPAEGSLVDSPLGDLLSSRAPPADIGACDQTSDLLQLLKQLEALNRCVLAKESPNVGGQSLVNASDAEKD